jgi:hypothetical protein
MNSTNWFRQPSSSVYKPCPSCGGREVLKSFVPAGKPGFVCVIVECKFCERRRASYNRKHKEAE